jgi:hypothetical protein
MNTTLEILTELMLLVVLVIWVRLELKSRENKARAIEAEKAYQREIRLIRQDIERMKTVYPEYFYRSPCVQSGEFVHSGRFPSKFDVDRELRAIADATVYATRK